MKCSLSFWGQTIQLQLGYTFKIHSEYYRRNTESLCLTVTTVADWAEACSTEGVKTQWGERKGLLWKKKKILWSPLLLSLIKFSALITIKPLSMYNNVCITEQHRCSPSTQLNIKMTVAVLIATRRASHSACMCVYVCKHQPSCGREGTPSTLVLSLRDLQHHP